jgi:hypothetical protein
MTETTTEKDQILTALRTFIAQRSGMNYANYGDMPAYNADRRAITQAGRDCKQLLREIELRPSITANDLIIAAETAYQGRLEITQERGQTRIDYTTGQYFPTEYRAAARAVLFRALWRYMAQDKDSNLVKIRLKQILGYGLFNRCY